MKSSRKVLLLLGTVSCLLFLQSPALASTHYAGEYVSPFDLHYGALGTGLISAPYTYTVGDSEYNFSAAWVGLKFYDSDTIDVHAQTGWDVGAFTNSQGGYGYSANIHPYVEFTRMLDENQTWWAVRIYHNSTIDGGNSRGSMHGYWVGHPNGLNYTYNGVAYHGFKAYLGPGPSEQYAWDFVAYTTIYGGCPRATGEVNRAGVAYPTMDSSFGSTSDPVKLRVADGSWHSWTSAYSTYSGYVSPYVYISQHSYYDFYVGQL